MAGPATPQRQPEKMAHTYHNSGCNTSVGLCCKRHTGSARKSAEWGFTACPEIWKVKPAIHLGWAREGWWGDSDRTRASEWGCTGQHEELLPPSCPGPSSPCCWQPSCITPCPWPYGHWAPRMCPPQDTPLRSQGSSFSPRTGTAS